jgi:hypothetical protein
LLLENICQQYEIHFDFDKLAYIGRYGPSFKAVNIELNYVKKLTSAKPKKLVTKSGKF